MHPAWGPPGFEAAFRSFPSFPSSKSKKQQSFASDHVASGVSSRDVGRIIREKVMLGLGEFHNLHGGRGQTALAFVAKQTFLNRT